MKKGYVLFITLILSAFTINAGASDKPIKKLSDMKDVVDANVMNNTFFKECAKNEKIEERKHYYSMLVNESSEVVKYSTNKRPKRTKSIIEITGKFAKHLKKEGALSNFCLMQYRSISEGYGVKSEGHL